jgi:hypothetical protein
MTTGRRTANQRAGGKVSDEEVKSTLHDEVLNWLADNLEAVVGDRYGIGSEKFATQVVNARRKLAQSLADEADELERFIRGERDLSSDLRFLGKAPGERLNLSEVGKEAFEAAAESLHAWAAKAPLADPPESASRATVRGFELMAMVNRLETRHSGEVKATPAGFVDLYATVFVPSALEVPFQVAFESWRFVMSDMKEPEAVALVKKCVSQKLKWERVGEEVPLFISVRTGSFTLGEILQELRTLKSLEKGQQEVALAVDGIADDMRKKIEREGFVVISMDDYPRTEREGRQA